MFSAETDPAFLNEFIFNASRSGGAGGQNVNKVSTKVEIKFHIANSSILTDEQKVILLEKLKNKINNEGYLTLTSQEERTQLLNKRNVVEKFFKLVNSSLIRRKVRKPTKPNKKSVQERLKSKKRLSEKKSQRKFNFE